MVSLVELFSFRFLGELKTPKSHFEINWPLRYTVKYGKTRYVKKLKIIFKTRERKFRSNLLAEKGFELLGGLLSEMKQPIAEIANLANF